MLSRARLIAALAACGLLCACNAIVLDPAGDVASQERNLLLAATALMLLVIVPVMALTVVFAWRYRQSNRKARYEPDWDHSIILELLIWSAPLLIIIFLGALTWVGTHVLDPYRALTSLRNDRTVAANARPLRIQAVALDWKWLFIYPEYGIATLNELAAPLDRPIEFEITADTVMNSLYIPALAGQIYAMPGMQTTLHAIANRSGDFQGFSANYSGAGFSGMHFVFHALAGADFDAWVGRIKAGGGALERPELIELQQPSSNDPARGFASVDPGLFRLILARCVAPGKACKEPMTPAADRG